MRLEELIENISRGGIRQFFSQTCDSFRAEEQNESHLLNEAYQEHFGEISSIGFIDLGFTDRIIICAAKLPIPLTETTSKRKQYEVARQLIRQKGALAGIFVFYDEQGRFRFSFVRRYSTGTRSQFTTFKRYSFYVDPKLPNKTFKQQIKKARFTSLDKIQEAFSIESVTNEFYHEFKPKFEALSKSVEGLKEDQKAKEDFALLFVIRIIFLGFVQKKGWLEKKDFLKSYWDEYNKSDDHKENSFYTEWLEPLFFEALNSAPGSKVKYGNNPFSDTTESILQMAPFLNGELFKPHTGVDNRGFVFIPDRHIDEFLDFLFQYNFTIEENTNIDEELELSPEFLGIIFERLVNKADGAVYTPRTEVDLMCRLSLVKWLEKNTDCAKPELFHLFFREGGHGAEHEDEQKDGSFSSKEIRQLYEVLSSITVCDPAAGSGAFPVGMMQVLVDIFEKLEKQPKWPNDLAKTSHFDRKKNIIAGSLYGAEVKHWAVWINQLRLWLSLFIDMPDDHKFSMEPLLPSLNFKIRCGDSLVQRIGGKIFPIRGHASLPPSLKGEITTLKKMKTAFFNNDPKVRTADVLSKEYSVFQKILETQLDEAKTKLRRIGGDNPTQTSFLEEEAPAQSALPLDIDTKARLKEEIQELEEELKALKQDRPFIWSIEFAEIFYERGGFDITIGNPPYIRQEEIADPCGYVGDGKEYKKLLKESLHINYPGNHKNDAFFKRRNIDGKSDLYTYFYAFTINLLNENGFHCFICSNSWLDVGFGVWLQEFLLQHCRLHYVIDNHAKRSFASADVNTIITLFEAPQRKMTWADEPVKFVAYKRPFEESIITENLLEIEEAKETLISPVHRTYVLSHETLKHEGLDADDETDLPNAPYIGEKWGGKYLRAPDIFAKILLKGKDKFVKLKTVADVKRGITTGCNEFFYLTKTEAKFWEIEEEFLKPVIKSPRECKSIQISQNDLKFYVFLCNMPKTELTGTYALKYIEHGEAMKIEIKRGEKKGQIIEGVHKLESVKNRKIWYSLGEISGTSFWVKETNKVLVVYFSETPMIADCRLYYADLPETYRYQLNSTINYLIDETLSRAGLGLGARSKMVYEVNNQEVLLFPEIDFSDYDLCRPVQDIFAESGIDPESDTPIEEQEPQPLPDRKALDDVIFDALGLTEEERKDVYRAVCRLVWNRISKAKNK